MASFPALCELSCKCMGGNHSAACSCLNPPFISKAHTNFTSILMEAQSQEEFVKRLEALPKHARDIHEWEVMAFKNIICRVNTITETLTYMHLR